MLANSATNYTINCILDTNIHQTSKFHQFNNVQGNICVQFPSIIQNNFTCSARLPSAKNPSMSSLVSEEAFGVLHPNAPVVSNSLTNVPRLQVKIYFIKLTLFMYSEFKRF